MPELVPLCVPFEEKEVVRNLGARWHATEKCWYVYPRLVEKLEKWVPRYYVAKFAPQLHSGIVLTIEVVPLTCLFSNVRSVLSDADWDTVRKKVYNNASHRCQICGSKGSKHPVEAHEIWHYDDATKVQRLDGLISLCPLCHQVKHIALSRIRGLLDETIEHMKEVNGWGYSEVVNYIEKVSDIHLERSRHQWKLDVSWLKNMGYDVTVGDRNNERVKAARKKALGNDEDESFDSFTTFMRGN